jgi:hypothetical protein
MRTSSFIFIMRVAPVVRRQHALSERLRFVVGVVLQPVLGRRKGERQEKGNWRERVVSGAMREP